MFTGIVQHIGTLTSLETNANGIAFTVAAGELAAALAPGDSLAVNGVCQTVESIENDGVAFTAVGETIKKTTLGRLEPGTPVHLERAATPDTALGGHIVQGHVDGVGEVLSFHRAGRDRVLEVRLPAAVAALAVPKGSIAIDGVSLTIVDVAAGGVVTITIVPFTIGHTIIGNYEKGTKVNVEADIVGKYVMEYLERINSA